VSEVVLDVDAIFMVHGEGVRQLDFFRGESRLHLAGSRRCTDCKVTSLKETQLHLQQLDSQVVADRGRRVVVLSPVE
jgi:hypothetical protein